MSPTAPGSVHERRLQRGMRKRRLTTSYRVFAQSGFDEGYLIRIFGHAGAIHQGASLTAGAAAFSVRSGRLAPIGAVFDGFAQSTD